MQDFKYSLSNNKFVSTQARCGDPRQGGAVSVGPIWHACIAIRPAKHRSNNELKLESTSELPLQELLKKRRYLNCLFGSYLR